MLFRSNLVKIWENWLRIWFFWNSKEKDNEIYYWKNKNEVDFVIRMQTIA